MARLGIRLLFMSDPSMSGRTPFGWGVADP